MENSRYILEVELIAACEWCGQNFEKKKRIKDDS